MVTAERIKIFCSFTSSNQSQVEKAKHLLEFNDTIECWLFTGDTDITIRNIAIQIETVMQESEYFILFWSEDASKKAWITHEIENAYERETQLKNAGRKDNFIVVIALDDTKLPAPLNRGRHLHIDEKELKTLRDAIENETNSRRQQNIVAVNVQKMQTVGDIASRPLRLDENTSISHAFVLMQTNHKRHAIVEDEEGKVAGRIAFRDIMEFLPPPFYEVDSKLSFQDYRTYFEAQNNVLVKEIMIRYGSDMLRLSPTASIIEGLNALIDPHQFGDVQRRVSAISIIKDEENRAVAVGMLEYSDLLCKLNSPDIKVSEAWRPFNRVITINAEKTVHEAYELMETQHIRHLPVLDANGHIVGMLEDIYLVEYIKAENEFEITQQKLVDTVMKPIGEFPNITKDMHIREVIQLFCNNPNTRCLPIRSGQKLTGILSFVDILKAMRKMYLA